MAQVFSKQNLRGKSFRKQDLTGADFTHADIRGTDFSNAILVGANFSNALAGQRYHWIVGLFAISSVFALLTGYIIAYAGALIGSLMVKIDAQPVGFWSGILALIILGVFTVTVIRRGLGSALGTVSLIVALGVVMVAALGEAEAISAAIVQAVAIAGAFAGVVLGAIVLSVACMLFRRVGYLGLSLVFFAGVPGALEGVKGLPFGSSTSLALVVSGFVAMTLAGLIIYVSSRVVAGGRNFFLIPYVATSLSSLGGTSFRGADLTDADFTKADLRSADLRDTVLKRTSWFQVWNLEHARLQQTYLENPELRHLVITKEARDQNYEYQNLRGINLESGNLENASFIGADLNESTLRNANLAGAKLVKTQLYQTDLSGICLTGAYIQDWGISTETNLSDIRCDYVFMRLPTKLDPDPCRKPDNRNEKFKDADFSDFIAPIIKTLGLYQSQNIDPRQVAGKFKTLDLFHYDGINPSAAAMTIQKVAKKHPEAEMEIIALEGKGTEKVRLQAKVTDSVDRSQLSKEYFEVYKRINSLPDGDRNLSIGIEEKDDQIRRLESLLESALKQPRFYVETYRNEGDFIMAQEKKGNIEITGGVRGNVSGLAAAGENQTMIGSSLGIISGSVTNAINQLPASPDSETPGLRELLTQLQSAIESEKQLADEDKAEALSQVKIVADAKQTPDDDDLQKAARTAMKILKGTIASLPEAADLVAVGSKLLPTIASFFM